MPIIRGMAGVPVIKTYGIKEMERSLARVRADLAEGTIVHLVSKRSGPKGGRPRHRAWITRECDPGYEAERVSCNTFLKHMAEVLDLVQDTGCAVEVHDGTRDMTAFWLCWCPPEALAREPGILSFHVMSRTGRALLRQFDSPVAVTARPAS